MTIRLVLLIIATVFFALLALNVFLTIGIIERHPLEWLGGGFTFLALALMPWAEYVGRRAPPAA